jgi:hypothetical protein
MFVDVLKSVHELVRMEANESGSRNFETLCRARAATPKVTGRKKAVAAVLLRNAENVATEIRITRSSRFGSVPPNRRMYRPARSTHPVRQRAAVMMSSPKIIITASLPKPANALSAGSTPQQTRARSKLSATTSAGMISHEKKTMAAAMRTRTVAIS